MPTTLGNTTQSDGTVNNRLTMDAEGLILDNRAGKAGSGWVGDEYGAYIYRFDANKQLVGQLHAGPVNGRRINQGMEGIAQSPDGTKLFGLLQSATIQDSGSGNQGRSNTRLVCPTSTTDTPSAA
ncbi:MAG: esterase-like activity of phytase family protein [Propionivibrio sp.]|nr:esterase-like activity of phytase family protein [Propionivibrio sp.]